jgi:predicted transcriptional regulator
LWLRYPSCNNVFNNIIIKYINLETGDSLIEKTIQLTTDKEEECIRLLAGTGMHTNAARVLVFFSMLKKATCHEIECGTGLRQPEVSVVLKYLANRGWIECRRNLPEKKGRPKKVWILALPFVRILDAIEKEKLHEMEISQETFRRIRHFL